MPVDDAKPNHMGNEAFARVKIDALLAAQGLDTLNTNAVRFEVQLPDGTRADRVQGDRHGRSLAVIEAERYSVKPGDAAAQAQAYAQQLGVPYAVGAIGGRGQLRNRVGRTRIGDWHGVARRAAAARGRAAMPRGRATRSRPSACRRLRGGPLRHHRPAATLRSR